MESGWSGVGLVSRPTTTLLPLGGPQEEEEDEVEEAEEVLEVVEPTDNFLSVLFCSVSFIPE